MKTESSSAPKSCLCPDLAASPVPVREPVTTTVATGGRHPSTLPSRVTTVLVEVVSRRAPLFSISPWYAGTRPVCGGWTGHAGDARPPEFRRVHPGAAAVGNGCHHSPAPCDSTVHTAPHT